MHKTLFFLLFSCQIEIEEPHEGNVKTTSHLLHNITIWFITIVDNKESLKIGLLMQY
jgi:hypothetical protein